MSTFIPHTIRIRVPQAGHIALIGDFNNWHSGAHPMIQVGPELWERIIDLPPGKHRYAFFVVENDADGDVIRSRVLANGSTLWVPDQEDLGVSVTAHPGLAIHTKSPHTSQAA